MALQLPCMTSTLGSSRRSKSACNWATRRQCQPKSTNRVLCLGGGRDGDGERQQALPAICSTVGRGESNGRMKVFVLSDLHTDYAENMEWIGALSSEKFRNDVLVVAGDVAETFSNFVATMSLLRKRFRSVFFVPGNHDLWCRRERGKYHDSLEKLNALLGACRELDIETTPRNVDGLAIVPIYSWYHESFDKEKEITNVRIPSLEMVINWLQFLDASVCKDFHACRWPVGFSNGDASLAQFFDSMNEKNHSAVMDIQMQDCQMITFSHFVPRQELCPEKRMLFYPNLPKIIGSDFLEARLRSIHGGNVSKKPACHVFGHTHFCWDSVLDDVRYVQAPLAYPRERKRRMNGGDNWLPFCIYSGGLTERLSPCFWSDYYSNNKRQPDITDLAPWVSRIYKLL